MTTGHSKALLVMMRVDKVGGPLGRAEADRVLALYAAGQWPPPIVNEWTLERVTQRTSPEAVKSED